MVLRLLAGNPRKTKYVDVGAGDLYFARRLGQLSDAPVYAVDINFVGQPAEPGLVICTNLDEVPSQAADCAILMDVLEHVDDDVALVRGVTRVLSAPGQLLVTVPAHAALWSEHDVFLGHRRRYNRGALCDVLQRGGFAVEESFYFYAIPCMVRALAAVVSRLARRERPVSSAAGAWPYPPQHLVTRAIRSVLNGDFRVSRAAGTWSGLGLSICAICQRKSA